MVKLVLLYVFSPKVQEPIDGVEDLCCCYAYTHCNICQFNSFSKNKQTSKQIFLDRPIVKKHLKIFCVLVTKELVFFLHLNFGILSLIISWISQTPMNLRK